MNVLTLTITADVESTIDDACHEAYVLAVFRNERLTFEFDGQLIMASPSVTPRIMIERYYESRGRGVE